MALAAAAPAISPMVRTQRYAIAAWAPTGAGAGGLLVLNARRAAHPIANLRHETTGRPPPRGGRPELC